MTSANRDLITWILGTLMSLVLLGGFAVRFILIPYLRDHLIVPMREVQRQVTENHHTNDQPTLPDRIEDLAGDVGSLARVLEGHLESSDRWLDHLTARLIAVEAKLEGLMPRHRR